MRTLRTNLRRVVIVSLCVVPLGGFAGSSFFSGFAKALMSGSTRSVSSGSSFGTSSLDYGAIQPLASHSQNQMANMMWTGSN